MTAASVNGSPLTTGENTGRFGVQGGFSPEIPPVRAKRSRAFLIVSIALAAGWWIILAFLAIFTANPVTLNRAQILRAPFVVMATVVGDPRQGQVTVEREWKKDALHGTITVADLADAGARAGSTYVIPLSRENRLSAGSGSDGGFHVAETPVPGAAPLIYAATPDAMNQLRAIMP